MFLLFFIFLIKAEFTLSSHLVCIWIQIHENILVQYLIYWIYWLSKPVTLALNSFCPDRKLKVSARLIKVTANNKPQLLLVWLLNSLFNKESPLHDKITIQLYNERPAQHLKMTMAITSVLGGVFESVRVVRL